MAAPHPKVRMVLAGLEGEQARAGVTIEIHPEWAPLGAERFMQLLDAHYFDECRLYRVIPDFIIQWGIPQSPALYRQFGDKKIVDDPVCVTNAMGTLSFATSGKDARGSQIFVNMNDNAQLDEQGFAPFARVVEGLEAFRTVYAGYSSSNGSGPNQQLAKAQGSKHFEDFPKLSFIERVDIV